MRAVHKTVIVWGQAGVPEGPNCPSTMAIYIYIYIYIYICPGEYRGPHSLIFTLVTLVNIEISIVPG